MVSNDDPIAEYYNRDNMTSFDGVMFINNLWNCKTINLSVALI